MSARWVEQRRATGHRPIEPAEVPFLERLGHAVRVRREEVGLTRLELAEEVGVTPQTIESIEFGARRTRASRLREIARAVQEYRHIGYGDLDLEDGFAHDVDLLADEWVRLVGPALAGEKNPKEPCPTCGHLWSGERLGRAKADG